MTSETDPGTAPATQVTAVDTLYAQVQQFYAHQMQLLDSFDAERWADTFTEDAVFDLPALERPVRGRAELAAAVRRTKERQERNREQQRHWVGMLQVQPQPDGTLGTRYYALIYVTPDGGASTVMRMCVIEDVLVPYLGEWRACSRRVTFDG
ncbi:nuclear transport factor 2 family protein [Streptomyces colonosanans]|uniref:SnoaL-like domain-containing protein n=1 Tax=Streptomyces colonosanans TaxID=1428652 RepID=A0A1S2P842_9ACTN|nr:nuclear transport factor 2 family protein [Streptomyces colonosanans]OIJ89722.1 hypothetical protein BIV24_19040 [Streptomyces colonosanans]